MTTVRLILGDQLNAAHSWFRTKDERIHYVMMEVRSETDYVRHHAQKVLGIFAAMRGFAKALQHAGHQVTYLSLDDPNNQPSFAQNIRALLSKHQATAFEWQQADEFRLHQHLHQLADELRQHEGIRCQEHSSEHFLCDRDALIEQFSEKVPRMEYFYRDMRRRHRILVDDADQPEGGKWNYDAQNRKKWKGQPPAIDWPSLSHDVQNLWHMIQSEGVQTLGEPMADALPWPITRTQAKQWLTHFIDHLLPHFGDYQDAMSVHHRTLFHSGLSFALNIKMLHPNEVIHAAWQAYQRGHAPLAATEGFIRQILGWREFVRGVYWSRMPEYADTNALGANRPLPAWYWSGETKMQCLHQAISQSLQTAYAHHIQRLMVTGAFALMAGCHPDEVDAWYLGIYVDAFEWVEMPNTRGMSQFGDGGVIASKPYCGSAGYMHKQSDYCQHCHYDRKKRHGDNGKPACPLNSLYWHFMQRHLPRFSQNHRMSMALASFKKMDEAEQQATLNQAETYLANMDSL